MARRRVNNPLALAVMACLIEKPMHPYEISTTLRSRGKELSIKLNYGSLYSVVDALQRHGLIEISETSRSGRRPERTVYAITDAGRLEVEDWMAELLSTPQRDFTSLEAGLSLMPTLPPEDVARLLESRQERLRIELRAIDAGREETLHMGLPELFVVESDFRRAMLAAELEFVTTLAARIKDESFGGTKLWRKMHELRDDGVSWETVLSDPIGYLGEEAAPLARDNGRRTD